MPKRKLEEVDSGEDLNSAQSESDDSNCSNVTNSSADVPTSTGEPFKMTVCHVHKRERENVCVCVSLCVLG